MGKVSEMILDGELCEKCSGYTGGGDGFPKKCDHCRAYDEPKKLKRNKEGINMTDKDKLNLPWKDNKLNKNRIYDSKLNMIFEKSGAKGCQIDFLYKAVNKFYEREELIKELIANAKEALNIISEEFDEDYSLEQELIKKAENMINQGKVKT